jgi:hypothetical protein
VITALILAAALVAPAHAGHLEVCYWKDRHKAHCVEGVYLTKKRPVLPLEVQLGKGKPCDATGCINLDPPRELGWMP